jgi:signal transduction histidine kinase
VRRLSLVGRVVVLASAVAMVVVLVVASSLVAIVSLRHAEARESRAKDVTAATLKLQSVAADLEASLRGFAITGNAEFRSRFNAADRELPSAFGHLQKLVADDPQQLRRAHDAQELLARYVSDVALPIINIIRAVNPEAARSQAADAVEKERANEIRGTLDTILNTEEVRSAARASHARDLARASIVGGSVALVLSAALVLLFGAWVARQVAAPVRRTSAAAAQVASGHLDVRVEERGAGEVGALVSAFNSMTRSLERGQHELLAQNQLLRESEEHKRDLISMISHEIRTPLASVCGFTSLLLEREFPREEERRYLEIIDQQARRLASIAGDFLDVKLLEGGGLTLDRAPFDLFDLTREQANLFFSHSTHTLELEVPDSAVVVNGDRDRIAQVIGNLLSNAIKYSPSGAEVRIVLSQDDGVARLSVEDEGMGIPPADRARVFEKFYRGAEAATAIGGTGLGLAVAREIVTSHGGDIDVESEMSRGSTFTVELPVGAATS